MNAHEELKPCPFCGSLNVALVGSFVRCGKCGAVGPYGLSDLDAAERWNERAVLSGLTPVRVSAAVEGVEKVELE